jgi:Leucine-rich repeat (LRR) protein
MPVLPESLKILWCSCNQLTVLPILPDGLKKLYCSYNKLTVIPILPDSLELLWCHSNRLTSLPKLPESLHYINYRNNPVYDHIKKFYNNDIELYHKINKIFVNKIASWFLECKYNPGYKYCRDRVNKEYDNLY